MNKIIITIIPRNQAEPVLRALVPAGYTAPQPTRPGYAGPPQRSGHFCVGSGPVRNLLRGDDGRFGAGAGPPGEH